MAKSAAIVEAELRGLCDTLDNKLATDRRDIDDLWDKVEAMLRQLAGGDAAVAKEQVAQLRTTLEEMRAVADAAAKLQTAHREEFVALRTQFQEHIKQYEKWDARRWTLIGLFIASLLSLVANLLVIAFRTNAK